MALLAQSLSVFFMSLPVAWPGFLFVGILCVLAMCKMGGKRFALGCLFTCVYIVVFMVSLVLFFYFWYKGQYWEMAGCVVATLITMLMADSV